MAFKSTKQRKFVMGRLNAIRGNLTIRPSNYIVTDKGTTKVISAYDNVVISNEYVTKLNNPKDIAGLNETRRFLQKNFKIDDYGQSYLNQLETSFNMYGQEGVKTQIAYILCNAKASTPEGKEYRKKFQKVN